MCGIIQAEKMRVALMLSLTLMAVTINAKRKEKEGEMDSMICPSCDRLFCTVSVKRASKLKCKGGITTDICGCCPVCAKQIQEPCGGEWNYLGKCDVGLYCKANVLAQDFFYSPRLAKNEAPFKGIPEGTCQKIPDTQKDSGGAPGQKVRDSLIAPKCQSKCTADFCAKNPRAICSAIDVVDMKRDCHGACQHTSCQACSFIDPDPDCGACEPDDLYCIKKFAKCVKRNYCTRRKFPCKLTDDNSEKGKFQCMVPKCVGKS